MKNMIRLLSALVVAGFLFSCGETKKDEPIVAPQGMNILDLTKYGKPFVIFVPDTTKAKLMVTEAQSGALQIRVGNAFNLNINEQAADIEARKKEIKEDEVNKLKSFVVEEPNAIMWESAIVNPEFHFVLNQKVGNSEYSFEDVRSTEAEPFGKDAIQKMFDSAKNIKEKKADPKS